MAKLYQRLATLVQARENCAASNNTEWHKRHSDLATNLARTYLPSGGGFDNASSIYLDDCYPDRLVLATSYHHMDDGGCYAGWTDHQLVVTPSLQSGFNLKIGGRNRNDIKDYIAECFANALNTEISDEDYKAMALEWQPSPAPTDDYDRETKCADAI